jgi:hypothetical protein
VPPLALDNSLFVVLVLGSELELPHPAVTFIYDHCPDICPLIVSHLHTALGELGPEAKKLQIIGVSTDPFGDTPKTGIFLAPRASRSQGAVTVDSTA